MIPELAEGLFIRDDDEGLFSRDIDGQLVRLDSPTEGDYGKTEQLGNAKKIRSVRKRQLLPDIHSDRTSRQQYEIRDECD